MSGSANDSRIVVGIDFGTTFSGVAFIYDDGEQNFDKIDIVKRWPGSNNSTSEKVPTQLCYTPAGTVTKWGYEVEPADGRIQYIKLLLDLRQELPHWVSRTELDQQLKTHAKTATSAAADYLTKLHEMARTELVKRYGEDFVESTSIEYILTVPAVWSDAAKHATVCAAQMAGLGEDLRMISEPEAAAVYSLSTMKSSGLKVGDVYIVLDAGGGTVDLITYEVLQMKPLKFREVVTGTGRLCGGLCQTASWRARIPNFARSEAQAWAVALDYFENYVKRNFLPSVDSHHFDNSMFNVPFPGVPDNVAAGIDCGFLVVSTAEVTEIFRPILDEIVGLVEHQRLEAAKAGAVAKGVILVGGFGQSSYLYTCLKQRFADGAKLPKACVDMPPSYEHVASLRRESSSQRQPAVSPLAILQPENAWTAVVRGAVMRGLENEDLVSSRKARRHYGFIVQEKFNPAFHVQQDKVWDDYHQDWKAKHQMWWIVKKGETIESGQTILRQLHRSLDGNGRTLPYTESLYICEEDNAPKVCRNQFVGPVSKLCSLTINPGQIPNRLFRAKPNSRGLSFFDLDYQLGIHIESGRLRFDMRAENRVYGQVHAKFE